ncbi:MAG: glycosyl hydrolase [bacterium]
MNNHVTAASMQVLIALVFFLVPISCHNVTMKREHHISESHATQNRIALEMQRVLDDELKSWYPLVLDTVDGGFFSDINSTWHVEGQQNKFIVTQARHVWSAAHTAQYYQKDNALRSVAAHGFQFLKNVMWDKDYGGFYDLVTRKGEPIKEDGRIIKRAYGNAFAMYGLAAYYRTSGDTTALKLAQETFQWLERYSYDSLCGGYLQFITREGAALERGFRGAPPKDQNSSIHLLEALTELYTVWPDAIVRSRLESMLQIVRDTLTTGKGYLVLFFERDWTPVSFRDTEPALRERNYEYDHVSFGHDVETAYLMLEASEALGLENDTTTLRIAKKMVDHALRFGWDRDHGGFFDGGYYLPGEEGASIVRNTKEWWAQAEALNTFLLMADRFPEDEHRYFEKFCTQWDYCKEYVIDQRNGGWYWGGADIVPENRTSAKASIWKCNYHTSRALINCIDQLKRSASSIDIPRYEPVNPRASAEARTLLAYLYSIRGKNIIAGHHNYVDRINTYPNRINQLTGKRPQIWGCDFIHYYVPGNGKIIVEECYKKHNEGFFITLMWHAGRPLDTPPFRWKESIQAKLSDEEWNELLTPGTKLHNQWLVQVDAVAAYLLELQALGVPVLWRPYHELNGVWFWWGNRKGVNGSARLYQMMYDRYVHHHKLNNLIWVWNANAPRQLINDEAYAYEDYFPGLNYVDVLAADVYQKDYRQRHYDELVRLGEGKIIALGEVGEVPSPKILTAQPMWTWFMIWGDFVDSHNTPQQIRDLYSFPRTLTHEDVFKAK